MKRSKLVTALVLFGLGLCLVLFSPANASFLVIGSLGGACLFGALAVLCAKESFLARTEEPLIEGTTNPVSEAFHSAIFTHHENPGAVAMIAKGEDMVLEGERRIREGDYFGGMNLVKEGEKRINKGSRLLGKKGGTV